MRRPLGVRRASPRLDQDSSATIQPIVMTFPKCFNSLRGSNSFPICEWPGGSNVLSAFVSIENPALFNNTVHDCGCQSIITHPHVSFAPRSDLTWPNCCRTVER
jgi:hypothetical protein